MKLEEEFKENHTKSGGIGMTEKQAIGCVEISENFAINFAGYLGSIFDTGLSIKEIKELLEIYKEKL